jgi:Flp pilus assembly secretin CpaC
VRNLIVILTIVAGGLVPAAAQEKPTPAAEPQAASSGSRQVPLRVQLTLTRSQGEKKISSVPYMIGVLTNSQKTSLRMGVQVPVTQTVFGAKSAGEMALIPQSSYSYRDVGTNIDCTAQDVGGGLFNLAIAVEDSAIHLDQSGTADDKTIRRDVPAFRSFRASFSMVLRDGQTMQYASATDPITGEVMRIDVALSLAK